MGTSSSILRPFCALIAALPIMTPRAYADNTAKIGVMLCLTGVCSDTGRSSLRGIELAVADLNSTGGFMQRPISLVVQDTREGEQSSSALTAFRNLILDPTIKLFVGPTWSNGGLPLVPLLVNRPDLTVISPSLGVAEFNEASRNIFNLWPHDEVSSRGLARVAIKLGLKTAAIISAQDPWAAAQAESFKDEFEKLSGKVIMLLEPLPSAADLRAEATRIAHAKPDLVLFTTWFHLNVAAESLRKLNYNGRFLAVQLDQHRLAAAHGTLEGTVVARFPASSDDFLSKFRARYGEDPAQSADTAYDSIMLLAQAARACNCLSGERLQDEMLRTTFQGVSGKIELDTMGGIKREPFFYKVSGSTLTKFD